MKKKHLGKVVFVIVILLALAGILFPLYKEAGVAGLTTLNDMGVFTIVWGSGWVARVACFVLVAGGLALTGFWEMLRNNFKAKKRKNESSN